MIVSCFTSFMLNSRNRRTKISFQEHLATKYYYNQDTVRFETNVKMIFKSSKIFFILLHIEFLSNEYKQSRNYDRTQSKMFLFETYLLFSLIIKLA